MLINPTNASIAKTTLRDVEEAARVLGLQIRVINASTNSDLDAAFATFAQDRPDALFIAGDAFFGSRAVQLVTLAARDRMPTAYAHRDYVAVGGLMVTSRN